MLPDKPRGPGSNLRRELEPGVTRCASKSGIHPKGSRPSHPCVLFAPRAGGFYSLSLDVPTVMDLHHGHLPGIVVDFEEDPEGSLPKSVPIPARKFFTPSWSRFLGQVLYFC